MSEDLFQPIGVKDFIAKYIADDTLFDQLPEFSFIKPVAAKAKAKNCTCGMGAELARTIQMYNDFVLAVEQPVIDKMIPIFGMPKICFQIQTASKYEIKCY